MTWDEFVHGVKTVAGKAANKIEQTADLATLQVKLTMAEHKLDEAYTELGKVAYRHFTSEDTAAEMVSAMMESVAAAQKNVDALKEQIKGLESNQAKTKAEPAPETQSETNA